MHQPIGFQFIKNVLEFQEMSVVMNENYDECSAGGNCFKHFNYTQVYMAIGCIRLRFDFHDFTNVFWWNMFIQIVSMIGVVFRNIVCDKQIKNV